MGNVFQTEVHVVQVAPIHLGIFNVILYFILYLIILILDHFIYALLVHGCPVFLYFKYSLHPVST